jgi:hypothetical protein
MTQNRNLSILADNVNSSGVLAVAGGGTGVTTSTGSGSNVLSNSPTLTTPNLGAATATSLNGLQVTNSTGTLTIPAATIAFSGANNATFTTTGITTLTLPTTGTLATTGATVASFSAGSTGLTPATATTGAVTLGGTLAVGSGGTGTGTAFTAGSVVFAGAGGVYSQNNAALFWNNSTSRFGVNTNAPLYEIDTVGDYATVASRGATTGAYNQVTAQAGDYWSLPSYTATLIQTYGSTASGNLPFLSTIPAAGSGGLLFTNTTNALVYTNGSSPLIFGTNGLERARITAAGKVGIGTTVPGSALTVEGSASIGPTAGGTTTYTNSTLTLIPAATPTTVATANQLTIGEYTRNSAYNLAIGYATISSAYEGIIQATAAGSAAPLILNPNGGNVNIGVTFASGATVSVGANYSASTFDDSGILFRDSSIGGENRRMVIGPIGANNSMIRFMQSGSLVFLASNGDEVARITAAGNVGIGTSTPGSPLDVVGNANASYISTTSSTSTTPTLSFNASNTSVAKGATVSGSYVQDVIQNKSATAGASANYVVSPNNGTDSTYYGEFGINSSVFSASTPSDFFSLNNQIYFSGHDGDVAVGSGNGFKTYFPWGATAASAHVINASGAIGFSTNLGTTLANSGTIGFGTSGQALITAGSGAAPAWGNVASPYSAAPLFGTGADGAVTISSGTTTLSRDMHYTNLTLSGSGKLNANGWRIYVSGTLDISAAGAQAIYNNATAYGSANSGQTGGANNGLPPSATVNFPSASGNGGAGSISGAGTAGSNGSSYNVMAGLGSGAGSAGGGGSGGAGGTITRNVYAIPQNTVPWLPQYFNYFGGNPLVMNNSAGGGGGGQGDGTNAGGGGGGGGMCGGNLVLNVRIIARGSNSTASILQALGASGQKGANGLAGNANGGGGGGGGGGGVVQIICETLTGSSISNAIDVSAGSGGGGGNGSGSGLGAPGAASGYGGVVNLIALSTPSYTQFTGTTTATGSAASGSTGGAGGTATASRTAL